MHVDRGGEGTSPWGGMGRHWHHPENRRGFSQGMCMGSGRPGARRSGNMDREHLQMERNVRGWSEKKCGDLEIEIC